MRPVAGLFVSIKECEAMSWLRMQGRGALVVLGGWAGLAAAQAPQMPMAPNGPPPVVIEVQGTEEPAKPLKTAQAAQPAPKQAVSNAVPTIERIVTVNEAGKSIRCRIIETWQLQDGTTAHKLQAIESGEYITIMD